ncbi:MAG: four helix bundle protein [bacterium]
MKSVEDLDVFRLAHEVTLEIYSLTNNFPEYERYGLISQIRRSSMSIPMNLMEGSHRLNTKEYRQFVGIARGSVGELKYQLMLSHDLGYISEDTYHHLRGKAESISKMLTRLVESLTDIDPHHRH